MPGNGPELIWVVIIKSIYAREHVSLMAMQCNPVSFK